MESVGDARSFLSAAREVALRKPIIVIKAGRTEAAARAAASHTGALTGSDDVLDAAFRRSGVLAGHGHFGSVLHGGGPEQAAPPQGPRLTIVTNAGGPAVLATDALIASGGELAVPLPKNVAGAERVSAAALEPQQSHRHSRRRRLRALRQGTRNRRRKIPTATDCWSSLRRRA